jgi:hypothetical protein
LLAAVSGRPALDEAIGVTSKRAPRDHDGRQSL